MSRWFFLLTSGLVVVMGGRAALAAPPSRMEITYELSRNGSALADIIENLQHGDGKYELIETWKGRGLYALLGTAKRSSRGAVAPDGLRPIEFSDERTGRKTSRASFDWSAKTLTMQYKGDPQTVPMPANAQDRLSFLLAFAFAPPGPKPVGVSVADGGSISTYVFEVVARERVKTPAGEFDAVKLSRRKDGPEDRRSTDIWLAPSRGNVPVRILVTEKDGTRLDQVAVRISAP
jgi:Protein of unknown function (DUF3108)